MEFWDLPTAVFEDKVLSSLSVKDLASLGQVSKQFHTKVHADSVWEAVYHHRYGPRTPIVKRAAEIAGGYRQLCRSRLLSDKTSGPGVHRATEAEEAAFVESVIGSGGWTVGPEGSGETATEGPVAIMFLVDTSLSMASEQLSPAVTLTSKIVSAALLKNPVCLSGALQFQLKAKTLESLKLRTAHELRSSLSNFLKGDPNPDPEFGFMFHANKLALGNGARLGPAMVLAREEFVRTNLPLDAPKCVVVVSDGLWSPAEVVEAQAAAAELCRGDLGPVRVFGVGFGKSARMDEFRGMLEAQGSLLPPQASARYLTLFSNRKPLTLTEDLTLLEDMSFNALSSLEMRLGIELDDEATRGSPGALWGPPAAWLVARLPPHRLRLTLEPPEEGHRPALFKSVLCLAPWVESIRVMPGEYSMHDFAYASLPYDHQELEYFSNLRELFLYNPGSIPALSNLQSLDLAGTVGTINFYYILERIPLLKELKIDADKEVDFGQELDFDLAEEIHGALINLERLERLTLRLPGPVWTLPDLSSCEDSLKSFSFTYEDSFSSSKLRQNTRQEWLTESDSSITNMVTVSDLYYALSDCASLESLEFEVMSAEGLEGIEDLAGLPSLKTLTLVCSMPRVELEEGQAQLLKAFSALKQVETIVLYESPNAGSSDWRCEYSWKEGTLTVKTVTKVLQG